MAENTTVEDLKAPLLAAVGAADLALATVNEIVVTLRERAEEARTDASERAEESRAKLTARVDDARDRLTKLQSGLPKVPVHDLVVHPRDRELVAGTHGRSVWIVDVLPIQDLTPEIRAKAAHLFFVDPVDAERGWRSAR